MTDYDLAARAKAGDRAAVNELLRAAMPSLRRAARRACAGTRGGARVFDEVMSEATERAWRAIPTWDPSRGPLASYIMPSIRSLAQRVADYLSHPTAVPTYDRDEEKALFAQDRQRAQRPARSMEEPAGREDDAPPLVATLAARFCDPAAAIDAERALGAVRDMDAEVLWRVACGESYAEIGEDMNCTAQNIERIARVARETALRRLSRGVPQNATPEAMILHLLSQGPARSRDIFYAMSACGSHKKISRILLDMRERGLIVIASRSGVHSTYALPEPATRKAA